jgi:Tol biopolymer transport system component
MTTPSHPLLIRMTKRALIPLALLALFGASSARAATLSSDTTAILSGTSSLLAPLPAPVSDSASGPSAVDQTGRFVAFTSSSDGLSNDDNDGVENVYVKDRLTGAVTLASRGAGPNGAAATQNCNEAAISRNGSTVAFVCDGPLDPADSNGKRDVYVRALSTGDTFLVSRASGAGAVGDGDSEVPVLSADGTIVAFESDSNNFGGTTDSSTQVYARRVSLQGATVFVSRGNGEGGNLPDGASRNPSISDDGNRVAFESLATNLVADATGAGSDVFVRQLDGGLTKLESRAAGPKGAPANGPSSHPQISGDGAVVVLQSEATNLVPRWTRPRTTTSTSARSSRTAFCSSTRWPA